MVAPAALVRAYLTMLPRLQAQEQLASVDAVSLGMGGFEAGDRQRIMGRLQAAMNGELGERAPAAERKPASAEQLAAIGIGVTILPSEGPHSDV